MSRTSSRGIELKKEKELNSETIRNLQRKKEKYGKETRDKVRIVLDVIKNYNE
jgi:hypothetical protein